ncbi:MAG: 2-hydroxyacyl-CoA dehydratase family protein [Thermoplasmata archaeon]
MRRPGRRLAGMTALVPPELIYASGWRALDVNNWIPGSGMRPRAKLCAWTACWREAILRRRIRLDALVVVAGGDCHNALADGQRAARAVPRAHYFFYPFDGDTGYMRCQLEDLASFLEEGCRGAPPPVETSKVLDTIARLRRLGLRLDRLRALGMADPSATFRTLVSFSDFEGDPERFLTKVEKMVRDAGGGERESCAQLQRGAGSGGSRARGSPGKGPCRGTGQELRRGAGLAGVRSRCGPEGPRVALIGVPPIYHDFHQACTGAGLRIVFDELPYEFLRLGGRTPDEMARSYATYTFARPVEYRLSFLKRELRRRGVDGVIHYAQFTCHHLLEDPLFREELDLPMLTVQGDLPGETPAQVRLRLEAFAELLGAGGG